MTDEESHTLLVSEPKLNETLWKRNPAFYHKIHLSVLYATIFTLLCLFFLSDSRTSKCDLFAHNTPLWDLVEYETVVFLDNIHELSPFQGPPDDVKDEIWDKLYRNTSTTVIDSKRAKRLPNSTMVAPGTQGDGIVSLENALRKSLYPERFPDYSVFFPNGTRNQNISIHHARASDHCVDRIRQATMCDANIGASFWRWNEHLGKWGINMRTTQTCRNFEKMRLWAVERNLLDWDPKVPSRLTDE
ncbi:hypothetical protein LEL_08439 [Akanthomyces lecanii RCEF 1005]|uniref:Tat pathway signal sequence n=1 Tax=Akanthomyces lecanii RCEF 1005 TaxID=1081108 RepID=A0A168DIG7_CORDF|nr:hypothetical protein LEL_08439 [Akanthomyces lecanii RCEF 1005]